VDLVDLVDLWILWISWNPAIFIAAVHLLAALPALRKVQRGEKRSVLLASTCLWL
jgi:hypothetical protein